MNMRLIDGPHHFYMLPGAETGLLFVVSIIIYFDGSAFPRKRKYISESFPVQTYVHPLG